MRTLFIVLTGLILTNYARAQSLPSYMEENDKRLDRLEQRIETLEQDRKGRLDAERLKEGQRQSDAKSELLRQCMKFRNNPADVARLKECRTKYRPDERPGICMILELEEGSCR
jgi:hypothetical protein